MFGYLEVTSCSSIKDWTKLFEFPVWYKSIVVDCINVRFVVEVELVVVLKVFVLFFSRIDRYLFVLQFFGMVEIIISFVNLSLEMVNLV